MRLIPIRLESKEFQVLKSRKQIIEPGTSFQVLVRSLVTIVTDKEWSGTGGKCSNL